MLDDGYVGSLLPEEQDEQHDEAEESLGSCCACGNATSTDTAMTFQLHKRCTVPGQGWGCFVCNLPPDGALAVVCDPCLEADREIAFACVGYPGLDKRVPLTELSPEPFVHCWAKHAFYARQMGVWDECDELEATDV